MLDKTDSKGQIKNGQSRDTWWTIEHKKGYTRYSATNVPAWCIACKLSICQQKTKKISNTETTKNLWVNPGVQ